MSNVGHFRGVADMAGVTVEGRTEIPSQRVGEHARVGNNTKTCKCALCTVDDTCCFHDIRLGPKTSVCEMNVNVVSTVTGCDVTNCATTLHGFNKHASSRREAVSDSRGVPRCTEEIPQVYACSHVSIIRLVRFTIRSACNSSLSLVSVVPAARRTRLAQLCPHTKHDSLWKRSRPSAFVPMSVGFTSVLTDDIVSSFRNTNS